MTAVQRLLFTVRVAADDPAGRWEPPWMALLLGVAGVLLALFLAWWLLLVVRIQDRFRE